MENDKIIFNGCTVRNFENPQQFLFDLGKVILEVCEKYEVKNIDMKSLKFNEKEGIQASGVFQGSHIPEE